MNTLLTVLAIYCVIGFIGGLIFSVLLSFTIKDNREIKIKDKIITAIWIPIYMTVAWLYVVVYLVISYYITWKALKGINK